MPKPRSVPIKADAVLVATGTVADGMLDGCLDMREGAEMLDDGGAGVLTEAELELDACRDVVKGGEGLDDDGAA